MVSNDEKGGECVAIYECIWVAVEICEKCGAITVIRPVGGIGNDGGATFAGERRTALTDRAHLEICEYLLGKRREFTFPIAPCGTAFQLAVWEALGTIPYGETRTYGELAAAIGRVGAARAVGHAAGQNPLWLAVPCHRLVGAHGAPGGYRWGEKMKRALLELERERR